MTVGAGPAAAKGPPSKAIIAPDWATGSFTVTRTGWVVTVKGRVQDTRADGDCVYIKASLYVDGWADPDKESPKNCSGSAGGAWMGFSFTLRPSGGIRFSAIRLEVCADDFPPDSCEGRTISVYPDRARNPQYVDEINDYMSMGIGRFLKAKGRAPGPFDWHDDGCSNSPDRPEGYNFLPACKRHDFGYRNYGHGLKASPLDSTRAYVNYRFKVDLYNECAKHSGPSGSYCRFIADGYVAAVVDFGGPSFYGN
ncbi:MAG: hypothetical protein H0W07_05775 [Chloroflexi bacterium]|nr:hypothetical protein [Chloroflexota bacterium]